MKKCFFTLVLFLGCSLCYGAKLEKIESLSSKVILQDTNGYFVLSDGSCWKVIPFQKRWRSLFEWWNDVQLVPENYVCVPNDWYLGTEIEIYPKYECTVNEGDASNQELLKQCTHLLVNSRTKQVLFAIALHPAECTLQLFHDVHEEAYNKGFNDGQMANHRSGTEIYNRGYSSGYQDGYHAGVMGQ